MREVKFRAWDDERGKMYGGEEIEAREDLDAWLSYGELAIYRITKGEYTALKRLQYTGLKDKNGVEIYEGDVVEREVFAFGEIRTFTGEVKMFECIWWIDSGTAAVPLWNEMHELNIIGNIYEHPHLLEDSK